MYLDNKSPPDLGTGLQRQEVYSFSVTMAMALVPCGEERRRGGGVGLSRRREQREGGGGVDSFWRGFCLQRDLVVRLSLWRRERLCRQERERGEAAGLSRASVDTRRTMQGKHLEKQD